MNRIPLNLFRAKSVVIFIGIFVAFFVAFSSVSITLQVTEPLSVWPNSIRYFSISAFPGRVGRATCKPKQNLMFLKTHKCASSTVQNIIMRFGDARNLTFVLPPHGNYLGHPIKFQANLSIPLPSAYSNHYNIFCHHTRWQEAETIHILPKDAVFVSILKEPAAMFESLYNWVSLDARFGKSLEQFLESPQKYYNNVSRHEFARNPMMFDFGLEEPDFEKPDAINSKIAEIDKRFSLIMLAEQMDESLVLLRNLLCWSWDDMVVFRVNARKTEHKKVLSKTTKERIRNWNSADTRLYHFFYERFNKQKQQYGRDRLREEVMKLRQLTDLWYRDCVLREISKNDTSDVRFKVWHSTVSGFQLTNSSLTNGTCIRLAMAENPFTDGLRRKLWPNFKLPGQLDKGVLVSKLLPNFKLQKQIQKVIRKNVDLVIKQRMTPEFW